MSSGTPPLARRWHPSRRRDSQPLGAPTVAIFTRGTRTFCSCRSRSAAALRAPPHQGAGGGGLRPPRRGHEPVVARRQTCSAFRIVSRKRPSMSKLIGSYNEFLL